MTDLLWQKLDEFKIGSETAQLGFVNRLARDNDWTLEFAEKVVLEYKRFIYLVAKHKQELTPSDAVTLSSAACKLSNITAKLIIVLKNGRIFIILNLLPRIVPDIETWMCYPVQCAIM